MKRLFGAALVLLLVLALVPFHSAAAQSTNNFRISLYDIQYELSRDSEGRSVLKTTEVITAEFPDGDQNHGLERAIPSTYEGHSTRLKIIEATNQNGDDQHSVSNEDGLTIIRIGDPDKYVHSTQTYRIVYEQRDVTKFFEDTGRDEWYWDTNGTEWSVPISALVVSVKYDNALMNAQDGEPKCYRGVSGATTPCALGPGLTFGSYTYTAYDLTAGENVTVAFGFKKDTFSPYAMSTWEKIATIWVVGQFFAFPVAVIAIVIASVMYGRRKNRTPETHTLVAEYIPPKDASVIMASQVMGTPKGSVFTAQLIDLAVRRFISIVETKPKSLWKSAEYDIVIQSDLAPLLSEEKEIISDMFGHLPKPGDRLALKSLISNMSYTKRTLDNDKKIQALIENNYSLRHKVPEITKLFYRWGSVLGIIALPLLSIPLGVAAGVVALLGYSLRPLTDKGLELRRYVLGLDTYIKASETERLAFLQAPDTAQKVGFAVDANDPAQLVKLYERTLPYAILFGHEKQWAKRLGEVYEQAKNTPEWYSGSTAFNAVYFASAISSFSQASTYSAGASSSSGGSSGGGSSGGGGGGGGGGGW